MYSGDLSQYFRNKFVRDDNTAVNESELVSIISILILLFVTCAKFAQHNEMQQVNVYQEYQQ